MQLKYELFRSQWFVYIADILAVCVFHLHLNVVIVFTRHSRLFHLNGILLRKPECQKKTLAVYKPTDKLSTCPSEFEPIRSVRAVVLR